MAELGWTPARLPSRGILNLHPETGETLIPDGEVQIRKLTTREESILLSQGAQGLERLDIIIKNCVKVPNGVHPKTLLITDRMALILALRTITFGPVYSFTYKCPHCNRMSKTTVDIVEELDEDTPERIGFKMFEKGLVDDPKDFEIKEPFTVELPDEKVTVSLRFLRGDDEKKIAQRSKRMRMQSNDPNDPSHIYRIALQIVEVNGIKNPVAETEMFAQKLTAGDSKVIRNKVDAVEPGIDLRVYPTCRNCGADNELGMPFTAEFFRPTDD